MTYRAIYDSIFDNEIWVRKITSLQDGETISIAWATHWDEIVWMEVFKYLVHTFGIEEKIKKWTIQLIIGDKEAYLAWKRLVDTDMNRVWNFRKADSQAYEYNRAKEICPYLSKSQYVLDLHSTTNPSISMLIPNNLVTSNLLQSLNSKYLIHGITQFLSGKPLIEFDYKLQNPTTQALVIECWQHYNEETIVNAIENTLILLNYYGFIDYNVEGRKDKTIVLDVKKCFYAKSLNINFLYNENPASFQEVKKWQVIYEDDWEKMIAEENFIIIMPSKPRYIWEEIGYVSILRDNNQ